MINIMKIYEDGSKARSQTFENVEDAKAFLASYVGVLIERGFTIVEQTELHIKANFEDRSFIYEVEV